MPSRPVDPVDAAGNVRGFAASRRSAPPSLRYGPSDSRRFASPFWRGDRATGDVVTTAGSDGATTPEEARAVDSVGFRR